MPRTLGVIIRVYKCSLDADLQPTEELNASFFPAFEPPYIMKTFGRVFDSFCLWNVEPALMFAASNTSIGLQRLTFWFCICYIASLAS